MLKLCSHFQKVRRIPRTGSIHKIIILTWWSSPLAGGASSVSTALSESSAAAPGMGEASTIVWQPPQCTEITRYPRNLQTEGGEKDAQSSKDGCEPDVDRRRVGSLRSAKGICLVSSRSGTSVMSVRGETAKGSVGTTRAHSERSSSNVNITE